ncbi:response regulator transcription factor [Hufsiella ginkgonis]|uniref:Response regulator n=1 Tax=Hufsiella ginkgonis TaxID=2695274 RepID=A0A7K1XUX6_9SPHI|nr:response regulator transcription factor [Hufsiella ginkgonis]MXV14811.1 response regulator [Hufsiella ginkgonis]
MQRKSPLKLAIVDNHNLFRKGLITLINLADKHNYLVVFEAENGRDMIKKLDSKALPDIILLDLDMPVMDGFESMSWLRDRHPEIAVLVISMVESEEAVVRMLRLGVKGYLSKDIEVEDIHQALQAIHSKGFYYTDFLTGVLIGNLSQGAHNEADPASEKSPAWKNLTENERKFITLSCSELTYEQIADKMCLSPKTIDGYRYTLFNKFNVKNRVGLVLFAVKTGLFKL